VAALGAILALAGCGGSGGSGDSAGHEQRLEQNVTDMLGGIDLDRKGVCHYLSMMTNLRAVAAEFKDAWADGPYYDSEFTPTEVWNEFQTRC
jgi:hypothetical protein